MATKPEIGHYETLGLEPGASQEQIKKSYRELVIQWHPDKLSHNLKLQAIAQEEMKGINAAYEYLSAHTVISQPAEPQVTDSSISSQTQSEKEQSEEAKRQKEEAESQEKQAAERQQMRQEAASLRRREQLAKERKETARRAKEKHLRNMIFGSLSVIYLGAVLVNVIATWPGVFEIWVFLSFLAIGIGLLSVYLFLQEQ